MKDPTITVVIPTHNRPGGLAAAVKSIFNQTLLPKELIVVDDGSNPPVSEEVFTVCPAGLSTKLIRNESPKGANNARNRGIMEAAGEWIAFLDDDDLFVPEKIQTICQSIKENPDIDFIYHSAKIYLPNENIQYVSKPGKLDNNTNNVKKLLLKNEIGGTSMTIIKKNLLVDAGLFEQGLPALQDVELYLRCAKKQAVFLCLEKPLTQYIYDTSKKSITFNNKARLEAMRFIRKRFETDYATLSDDEKKLLVERELKSMVFKAILNKQKRLAINYQWQLFANKKDIKNLVLLMSIPFGTWFVFKLRSIVS